mgnify:CR=1 FL=1
MVNISPKFDKTVQKSWLDELYVPHCNEKKIAKIKYTPANFLSPSSFSEKIVPNVFPYKILARPKKTAKNYLPL